jgi:hypothetical protein
MVYEQFDKATALMSAFAILSPSGEYVARVVIKYPKDGAGRLRCYFQAFGSHMVAGSASGYGYDKAHAAMEKACMAYANGAEKSAHGANIANAVNNTSDGKRWQHVIEDAGYRVLSVI